MDSLEESVRRALHTPYGTGPIDADDFLADVHRGARARRTRRAMGGVAATVAVVTTGGYAVMSSGILTDPSLPVARQSTVAASAEVAVPSLLLATAPPVSESAGSSPSAWLPASTSVATAETFGDATVATSPPPEPVQALSLSATGTQHQWVLIADPDGTCPTLTCAVVEVTDDAGRSWDPLSKIDVPRSPRFADRSVSEVRFAGDGTDGWVFGGDLLATHDAGASWTKPTLPVSGTVTSLEAWGDFVYAVVSDEQGSVSLVRSPVSHDDWTQVDLGSDTAQISALVVSERVVGVLTNPTGAVAENVLLTSTDGTSWSTHQPCVGSRYPTTLSTTGDSLWVMCSDDATSVASVSIDDGQTWVDVAGEFQVGSQLAARDASTAAVVDPAGDTITLVGADSGPVDVTDSDLTDIVFAGFTNPTTGYVLDAGGQVLRTDDGGRTWEPYSLPH